MKTKAIATILTFIFVLSLAACDDGGPTDWVCADANISFTLNEGLEVTNAKLEAPNGEIIDVAIHLSNGEANEFTISSIDGETVYAGGTYTKTKSQIIFSTVSCFGQEASGLPAIMRFKKA